MVVLAMIPATRSCPCRAKYPAIPQGSGGEQHARNAGHNPLDEQENLASPLREPDIRGIRLGHCQDALGTAGYDLVVSAEIRRSGSVPMWSVADSCCTTIPTRVGATTWPCGAIAGGAGDGAVRRATGRAALGFFTRR